jgi:hypothetical protein
MTGFSFDSFNGPGQNWQPLEYTGAEETDLFEAPDFGTPSEGTTVTRYLSGPQGGETWFTENWTIANDPGVNFTAPQPGSSITLNGDSNEFESAAWTYDTLWVTGNYECPNTSQLCPLFVVFDAAQDGQPIGLDADFAVRMSDGSTLFYPALATTINTESVLGVVDYTCSGCPHYASSGTFQLNPSGSYQGGAYQNGNSVIPGDYEGNEHRWGDVNGCSYVPNSSPARVTCVGEFALNSASASEVYTVSYS